MNCYDTNVFINRALIDKNIRNRIIQQFDKKECIILRSIEQELLWEHFPKLSRALIILRNQVSKTSFKALFDSELFKEFKNEYPPIAEYILSNYKKSEVLPDLINVISNLTFFIGSSKCFYPTTREEFEDLEKNPPKEYAEMRNRVKNKDKIHLGLLEWYGKQINENNQKISRVKFISCDRRHITGYTATTMIKSKYKFIEPVDCENYFSSLN